MHYSVKVSHDIRDDSSCFQMVLIPKLSYFPSLEEVISAKIFQFGVVV